MDTKAWVINSIPEILFYKDLDGNYLGGNEALSRLIGRPLNQIVGMSDLELFPKELAENYRGHDKATLRNGKPVKNIERATYPNGEEVVLETLKAPLRTDEGKVIGVVGVSRVISKQ